MSSSFLAAEAHPGLQPIVWRTRTVPQACTEGAPEQPDPVIAELQARLVAQECHIESRLAEARHAGFEAGAAQAQRDFETQLRPVLENLAGQLSELTVARERLLNSAEQSLVNLAFAIARRVLNRELTLDATAVAGIVRSALETLRGHHVLRVRVHPRLESHIRSAVQMEQLLDAVEIVPDRTLTAQGLVFETERGDLDASIETQLDEIRRGLTDG
jgi:flagellar assembly protein FliH